MATKDFRYSLRMSDEMKAKVTRFWHEHALKNMNETITQLIEIGFQSLEDGAIIYTPQPQEKRPALNEPSANALELAKEYDRLDSDYQAALKSVVKALSKEQALRADNHSARMPE